MTIARYLPHGARAASLILIGTALIAFPLALSLTGSAILLGVAAGIIAVTLGIAGTALDGRGTIPVASQAIYDRALALALLAAAIVFGATGQDIALTVFGLAGVASVLIATTTRYVAPAT